MERELKRLFFILKLGAKYLILLIVLKHFILPFLFQYNFLSQTTPCGLQKLGTKFPAWPFMSNKRPLVDFD